MSKSLFVAVALLVVLGTVTAATDEFMALARKHGALKAPEQQLPEEGGHCPDILGNWECPRYQYFRDRVGFEFREYAPTTAVVCVNGGAPGQIYQNLFPCYRQLDDYFVGQNSAGLRINRTAPVIVEVLANSASREDYGVVFFLPREVTTPPAPRAGSPIRVVTTNPFVIVSATFGPTDLFGAFGPNEGDYQVYDAASNLLYRLERRGLPAIRGVFLFSTYSAPPAAERRANLRHEAWIPLNISASATTLTGRSFVSAL
jgi:hypothetical protein